MSYLEIIQTWNIGKYPKGIYRYKLQLAYHCCLQGWWSGSIGASLSELESTDSLSNVLISSSTSVSSSHVIPSKVHYLVFELGYHRQDNKMYSQQGR